MEDKKMMHTAKILDRLTRIGGKLSSALGIVCVVISLFTLFFGSKMFAKGAIAFDLDFIKFHLGDLASVNETCLKWYVSILTFVGGMLCFSICYISTLLRKIFAPMKNGRPFEPGISGNLRKIGWIVLACGCVSQVLGIIGRIMLAEAYSMDELFVSPSITGIEYKYTIDLNFVLIACIVFLLSYIFTYGQKLQQDSDETL